MYMEQPPEFDASGGVVSKLQKFICGLKESPRAWLRRRFNARRTFLYSFNDPVELTHLSLGVCG